MEKLASKQRLKIVGVSSSLTSDVALMALLVLVYHQAVQQSKWLDEVRSNLKPGMLTSIDVNVVRRLIQTGVSVGSHPSCERAMSDLQQLLTASDTCEQKALKCLKARSAVMFCELAACILLPGIFLKSI